MASNIFQTPQRLQNNENQATLLNGKPVQRSEVQKKKNALSDLRNLTTTTPMHSKPDKKESSSSEQTDLLKNIGLIKNEFLNPNTFTASTSNSKLIDEQLNSIKLSDYYIHDTISSFPVDYHGKWAEKDMLTDQEVNDIISEQIYHIDEHGDCLPPPPSPFDELQSINDSFEAPSLDFDVNSFYSSNNGKEIDRSILDNSLFDYSVNEMGLFMDDLHLSMECEN